MKKTTLVERVSRDFSKIKLENVTVKVPRLKAKKEKVINKKNHDEMFISSIVNNLIKNSIKQVKAEKKEKGAVQEESRNFVLAKGERGLNADGGYDAISKSYGISPNISYLDYGKLFSYLGKFRAQGMYENFGADDFGNFNAAYIENSFSLIDKETMEKGGRHVKYLSRPGSDIYTSLSSLVPAIGSMSSAEWESFKLFMVLDKVTYLLKTSTS